ncbi:MAG: ATP-binding protein [Candidatus Dormibacteria bacterium]
MPEERRVVTILFADVVGSTRLGRELDPEDLRALMARYYAAAQAAVAEHGGTLEKFIGDAVMAVFGLPRAHGDDAERGAATALALREAIREDPALDQIQLRFGLATGEVVATRDPGRDDFLVTGDAVNVAARLQQLAQPWEIIATERTAFDAHARFEFGDVREEEIRGHDAVERVRVLMGPRSPDRAAAGAGFVGREDELEQLRLTARRSFRDRTPGVVSIVATAGAGKSRLVEQFVSTEIPALAPRVRVETAQCLPYGRQLTYWPLRPVLFNLAGISDTETSAEIVASVERWLGNRAEAELLGATVGADNAELANASDVFAAWRSALARAAAADPLVIIFEDLHWSSETLLDLVEFVTGPGEQLPVLMLAIARPELIDRRPTWGGGRRNFVSLYLDPLSDSDIGRVVGPMLAGAEDELAREVVRRSEGNPFFAGELARAALETGGLALPDTVQATVLARIDLLEEAPRRILQVASVFGRSFAPDAIVAVEPALMPDLEAALTELRSRDLVRREAFGETAFRHILIRDVAYSTLPRAERSRLHAAAADWFESHSAGQEDALAEIIALHLREAATYRGTPELRSRAVEWLRRAADAALRAAATTEAETHLRAALQFADSGDVAADIWIRIGDLLVILSGGYPAYRGAYEAAANPRTRLVAMCGMLMTGLRWAQAGGQFELADLRRFEPEAATLVAEVGDRVLEGRSGLVSHSSLTGCRSGELRSSPTRSRSRWRMPSPRWRSGKTSICRISSAQPSTP